MNQGLGTAVMIVIIVVFIVLVSAYMAFNINYTKAFRMKNKIIDIYEKYDGRCNSDCENEINEYSDSIGYNPGNFNCSDYQKKSIKGSGYLFCQKQINESVESNSDAVKDRGNRCYYKIVTKIDIRIPIVDNLLGVGVFSVSGDTKLLNNCAG